jgi:hypothetical protein
MKKMENPEPKNMYIYLSAFRLYTCLNIFAATILYVTFQYYNSDGKVFIFFSFLN